MKEERDLQVEMGQKIVFKTMILPKFVNLVIEEKRSVLVKISLKIACENLIIKKKNCCRIAISKCYSSVTYRIYGSPILVTITILTKAVL